jgi:uncharacterized protein YggT (Ycf19 family)
MVPIAAVTRYDVANYVADLFGVYIACVLIYFLLSWVFAAGVRVPYSVTFNAVLQFLRDVCEPYLRIFRRFIPAIGVIDVSGMVAFIVLLIVRTIVVNAISGN